jgi:hypothetical protein
MLHFVLTLDRTPTGGSTATEVVGAEMEEWSAVPLGTDTVLGVDVVRSGRSGEATVNTGSQFASTEGMDDLYSFVMGEDDVL